MSWRRSAGDRRWRPTWVRRKREATTTESTEATTSESDEEMSDQESGAGSDLDIPDGYERVEQVLAARGKGATREALVRWAGHGPEADAWVAWRSLTVDLQQVASRMQVRPVKRPPTGGPTREERKRRAEAARAAARRALERERENAAAAAQARVDRARERSTRAARANMAGWSS